MKKKKFFEKNDHKILLIIKWTKNSNNYCLILADIKINGY